VKVRKMKKGKSMMNERACERYLSILGTSEFRSFGKT